MRKSLYRKILAGLLLIGISLACSLVPFVQVDQQETETPSPVSTPRPTDTRTPLPTSIPTNDNPTETTELVTPATPTPKFAPFCEPGSANVATPTPLACQIPIAEQSALYCSNKVPYSVILINEGSSYEVLTDKITCSDGGKKDGKQILTCTGPMALPFEMRVCDPACAIPTFRAVTTRCPENYTFDEFLRCCEQRPQPIDQNCVVLSLQTKGCVLDCSKFTKENTCYKNARVCEWDYENEVCQPRK